MATNHDKTAERIARKEGVAYNRGQGPDVIGNKRAVEVESKGTVDEGFRQLQGYRKPVYIAGADAEATKAARRAAKGTTVGVMDQHGQVVKRSTRKRG